jgi:rare lipoprotein A (peptidoglycan hydrolase)
LIRLLTGVLLGIMLVISNMTPAKAHNGPHHVEGIASYYDCLEPGECNGIGTAAVTATGEHYNPHAHRCAVLGGTPIRVGAVVTIERIAYRNGKKVVFRSWCRVNDTGSGEPGRVLDVTPLVRDELHMGGLGTVRVTVP